MEVDIDIRRTKLRSGQVTSGQVKSEEVIEANVLITTEKRIVKAMTENNITVKGSQLGKYDQMTYSVKD
jgi:hypothetical protein